MILKSIIEFYKVSKPNLVETDGHLNRNGG